MTSFKENQEELNSQNMKRILALDSINLGMRTVEDITRWKNTEATYIATLLNGKDILTGNSVDLDQEHIDKMVKNSGQFNPDEIIKWANIYYDFFEKVMNK
jgi:hypothetical protein